MHLHIPVQDVIVFSQINRGTTCTILVAAVGRLKSVVKPLLFQLGMAPASGANVLAEASDPYWQLPPHKNDVFIRRTFCLMGEGVCELFASLAVDVDQLWWT